MDIGCLLYFRRVPNIVPNKGPMSSHFLGTSVDGILIPIPPTLQILADRFNDGHGLEENATVYRLIAPTTMGPSRFFALRKAELATCLQARVEMWHRVSSAWRCAPLR